MRMPRNRPRLAAAFSIAPSGVLRAAMRLVDNCAQYAQAVLQSPGYCRSAQPLVLFKWWWLEKSILIGSVSIVAVLDTTRWHHDTCSENQQDRNAAVYQYCLQSLEQSITIGLYRCEIRMGFARALPDYVALAFLAGVFALDCHRGKGLGAWIVAVRRALAPWHSLRAWAVPKVWIW